jgi:putative DNA primase/helicase
MAERREEVMIALAIDHAKSSRIVTLRTSEATYVYEPRLGHYRSTGHLELTNVAATLLESYNTTVTDPDAVIPRTLTIIKDMQHLLRVKSTVDQDWFINCAQKYINMRSGFLDLTTLAFIKKDSEIGSKLEKELGFLYLLDYDFDEHAAAPRWDQFLREIFPEDTEALSLLIKEWIGYCVSNDMQWAEKSMALVGSGANGKSVLINLLKSLVGTANVSAIQMSDLGKDYSVAMLEHSFVNLCSEMPRATSMLAARIKALSSQEDMQMARRPYEKPFSFLSRAKLMFAGNEVPDTYDNSDGFYRRFILVPFKASFMGENCDPHLIKKLRMERPGILAQCLRAYQEARERKHFTLPSSVVAAQEDMRGKNDTMGGWIETCLERDVDGTLYREQMAASYAAYAQSIGDRMQRGDQATLAHRIVAAVGGEMVKSGRVIVRIKGVRLKDAPREF